jgi:hypothetical protein
VFRVRLFTVKTLKSFRIQKGEVLYFEEGGTYGQVRSNYDTRRANWQYPKTR